TCLCGLWHGDSPPSLSCEETTGGKPMNSEQRTGEGSLMKVLRTTVPVGQIPADASPFHGGAPTHPGDVHDTGWG
ncbi:hypothetical protein, partial [Streptomyces graminis]